MRLTKSEILEVKKGQAAMNYEELEVVEIGKAEDVVLANGVSQTVDNQILLTRFP